MSFSESKSWVKGDLQRLIDQQLPESVQLDYKASGALKKTDHHKKEIAKDVSSFANSGGGIIVYGICEDSANHLPESLDEGVDPIDFSEEWLENVIQGNVLPKIQGLHINQIALDESSFGKVAYVVTIPQSVTAHQVMCTQYRYFKRYNFSASPMAHYEIVDVLNRNKSPNVFSTFEIPRDYLSYSTNQHLRDRRRLRIFLENQGSVSAKAIKLILHWPFLFRFNKETDYTPCYWQDLGSEEASKSCGYSIYVDKRILFPGEKVPLDEIFNAHLVRLNFHALNENLPDNRQYISAFHSGELVLRWRIFADDMSSKIEDVSLKKIGREEDFFYPG